MPRRPRQRGFTLVELLVALTVLTVLSVLAYPALRTFAGRNKDVGVATDVARRFNKVRDQARRRNRAYIVRFERFNTAEPLGVMEVLEGNSPSCHEVAVNLGENARSLIEFPFGRSQPANPDDYPYEIIQEVGLRGWVPPGQDNGAAQVGPLTLCLGPDGAVSRLQGAGATPLAGRLRLLVQQFESSGQGSRPFGPARQVELTFAGGARLRLD